MSIHARLVVPVAAMLAVHACCRWRRSPCLCCLGMQALSLYYDTDESKEGVRAFLEKRKSDFRRVIAERHAAKK